MKRKWKSGPPPHIGWWNASVGQASYAWRWWDGKCWSVAAFTSDGPRLAARAAGFKAKPCLQKRIEWTDYWPENARVERKAP